MPSKPLKPDSPEGQEIQLRLMDEHVTMTRWTQYSFASDFLTPSDGFSFTVADEELPDAHKRALRVGARVSLNINSIPVADGRIDSVEIGADKRGGWVWNIHGRDRLGMAVDTTADPSLSFKEGATLADALKQLFTPFGWITDDHYVIDNTANRLASSGGDRGTKSSKGKKTLGRPLKDVVLHQTKPHNHEGVFAFATRMSQRFGLWIWATSDGEKLVVSKPDFEQEPTYHLRRRRDGTGNIVSGTVKYDGTDQPSVIIADGFSGGGEFGKGRIKAYIVNPFFGVTEDGEQIPEIADALKRHPDAKKVTLDTEPETFSRKAPVIPSRPIYLHDDESKTQEQLNNYVKREMSLLLRKSLQVRYTVEGHGQMINGVLAPWVVDSVVKVEDDPADLDELLYVLGVTYEKSRSGGTFTHLDLIRLNSIQF